MIVDKFLTEVYCITFDDAYVGIRDSNRFFSRSVRFRSMMSVTLCT